MFNGFDGTEALTYTPERCAPSFEFSNDGFRVEECEIDGYPSLRFSGAVTEEALDCLSETRDLRERVMNRKVAEMLCDDDPYMRKSEFIDDEHLGSCDPYDGIDETQMGCAGEIAEALGSCDPYAVDY